MFDSRERRTDRRLFSNTHLDVVPPSEGQNDPFLPRREEGEFSVAAPVMPRGKRPSLFALALLLRERGLEPSANLVFHLVIEEENGGNGTLAMIRRGVRADAVVVIEPTEMAVVPAVRGRCGSSCRLLEGQPIAAAPEAGSVRSTRQ